MSFAPPEDSPLTNRDYTNINNALAAINRAERKIEAAQRAGVDCGPQEVDCQLIRDKLERLKATYFPHKP